MVKQQKSRRLWGLIDKDKWMTRVSDEELEEWMTRVSDEKSFRCKYCGAPCNRLQVCEKHLKDEMELMRSKGWY